LLLSFLAAILFGADARCEEAAPREESPSVVIKKVADGLVVLISNHPNKLEGVRFGCVEQDNAMTIDLPTTSEEAIVERLKRNPNIVRNGVTALPLPQKGMQRLRVVPKAKLLCAEAATVSSFRNSMTYLYPIERRLALNTASATGFEFDENNPQPIVKGKITLRFDDSLGGVNLAEILSVQGNTIHLRFNGKDFGTQEALSTLLPIGDLGVVGGEAGPGRHSFTFQSIRGIDIGKVNATLTGSPASDELAIDLSLTVSLYATAKKFYEQGNTRRALLYMEAAKGEPNFEKLARMSIGTIYWNEDRFGEALANFRALIPLDKGWEYPDARYFAAKASYQINKKLSFEMSAMLKEYLRRCSSKKFARCAEAAELSDRVNESKLQLTMAAKADVRKLTARLADPTLNIKEVQKNVFHFWATWCPVCLEEMPRIMQYAVEHPNVTLYIVSKFGNRNTIFNTLIKSGAIKLNNIVYYIDTKDDTLLKLMVPASLANKEPVTPLPISVFAQRDVPFYLTDRLNWTETEIAQIWKLKYQE
jgi:thiol-disulfide isomerase/thioredoxin